MKNENGVHVPTTGDTPTPEDIGRFMCDDEGARIAGVDRGRTLSEKLGLDEEYVEAEESLRSMIVTGLVGEGILWVDLETRAEIRMNPSGWLVMFKMLQKIDSGVDELREEAGLL